MPRWAGGGAGVGALGWRAGGLGEGGADEVQGAVREPGVIDVQADFLAEGFEDVGGGGLGFGVGGDFAVREGEGFAADDGAAWVFFGDVLDDRLQGGAPGVVRFWGGVGGGGRLGGEVAGGEAGFQRDDLADDGGEPGEAERGVRVSGRGRRGRAVLLGGLGFVRGSVLGGVLGGGGLGGGGAGEAHGEVREFAAQAQMAREALWLGFGLDLGDGVQGRRGDPVGLEQKKNMERATWASLAWLGGWLRPLPRLAGRGRYR